jgi:hypothetical protein
MSQAGETEYFFAVISAVFTFVSCRAMMIMDTDILCKAVSLFEKGRKLHLKN